MKASAQKLVAHCFHAQAKSSCVHGGGGEELEYSTNSIALAVKDDFQASQTAKARPGSSCAVTPEPRDKTASVSQGSIGTLLGLATKFHP
jgi:hypothetical protein